jgi:hypothetical protein
MSCEKCNEKGITYTCYHEGYDSYYCGICGEWLEPECDEPDCDHCLGRPQKANLDLHN